MKSQTKQVHQYAQKCGLGKKGKKVKKELPPAQQAELRFLRQQVDFWMEAHVKKDASPSAQNRYWYAKEDLRKFVINRQKEGFSIRKPEENT